MKPFRTNKADRAKFTKVLGLRQSVYADPRAWTEADIRTSDDIKILARIDGMWMFYGSGFQWTVKKLIEICSDKCFDSVKFMFNAHKNIPLGKDLFHAVVELHDQEGIRNETSKTTNTNRTARSR